MHSNPNLLLVAVQVGDDDSSGAGMASTVAGVVSIIMALGAVVYLGRVIKKAVDKAERAASSSQGSQ